MKTVLGLGRGGFLVTAKFVIVGSNRSHCASDDPTSQNKTDPYLNTKCMPWIICLYHLEPQFLEL